MTAPFSRYLPDVVEWGTRIKAKAVYCFAIDGDRGTGGCPLVMGMDQFTNRKLYEQHCRELVVMLRRSATMLEADLKRQGFGDPPP
jgi:hypothetical protein